MLIVSSLSISDLTGTDSLHLSPRQILGGVEKADGAKLKQALLLLDYPTFLATPYWWAVSTTVKEAAGRRCQFCNSPHDLQTHHRSYQHHGEEHLFLVDLICLCDCCHSKFHNKPSKSTLVVTRIEPPAQSPSRRPSKAMRRAMRAADKLGVSAESLMEMHRRQLWALVREEKARRVAAPMRPTPVPRRPPLPDIPTCSPEEKITLTRADVEALKNGRGAFTGFTVAALGLIWSKLEKGWGFRLIGTTIPRAQYLRALAGRNILKRGAEEERRMVSASVLPL